jgi:precorrin-3B methylase
MLSFGVAKELGMTVQQLHANVTAEELIGWSAYFSVINRRQDQAMKKAQRRR